MGGIQLFFFRRAGAQPSPSNILFTNQENTIVSLAKGPLLYNKNCEKEKPKGKVGNYSKNK